MIHGLESKEPDQLLPSESRRVGVLLAIAGGGMNAYSWLLRGEVFATMMTGNLLYFTFNLVQQRWSMLPKYFIPIVCFFVGSLLADWFRFHDDRHSYHWREGSSVFIAILLMIASLFSEQWNFFSAILISFAGGLQAETYTKINGKAVATTMGTGNFKNIAHWMAVYFHTKDPEAMRNAQLYISANLFFTLGAVAEGLLTLVLGFRAIYFVAALHLMIAWMMHDVSLLDHTWLHRP